MGHCSSKDKPKASAKNLVIFEVLGGHVRDAEWRPGDGLIVGVLGLSRPYVKVAFGAQTDQSVPRMKFLAQSGCDVNFNKRMVFSLDEGPDCDGIQMTVFDQRTVQAAWHGDPVIGTAEILIERDSGGTLVHEKVELKRNGSENSPGWLSVQYRVMNRDVVRDTLHFVGAHSLRDISNTMVSVLKTPVGVNRLLETRPKQVTPAAGALFAGCIQEKKLRKRLEQLAASFFREADSFSEETDAEVLGRLAPLSREFLLLIADFAQPKKGEQLDTVALASEWLKNLFLGCAEVDQSVAGSGTSAFGSERLHRWLTSSHLDVACLEPLDTSLEKIDAASKWTPGVHPPPSSVLGSGAYGCVFRARDKQTKQLCAVKQMMFQAGRVDEAVAMRECEVAEVLCSNVHPCVVRLFSVHKPSNSCAVLLMEYCASGDLQGAIDTYRRPGCYTVPPRAKTWLAQIFLGLEFLHLSIGMLVRDVKPENIILTTGGFCAKLTDFGVSRLDTASDGAFTFHPGVPPGSPLYVAPEVVRGAAYDYYADFYSLGVLAWVLYTGGLVSPPMAVPPCAKVDARQGPLELQALLINWQMLKACIVNPRGNDARPLPSEEMKDFVLRLTDRTDDYHKLGHEDVRNHPLLQDMALPPYGGAFEVVLQWLRNF